MKVCESNRISWPRQDIRLPEFQHTVTTPDGIRLLVREYVPEIAGSRRNLLLLHGACEHGGRYMEFARTSASAGWRVLIPDLRGHGLSTGVPVYVRHFDEYLQDVRLLCRHFSLDPQQTVVVGHSLGGLILARLLETQADIATAACLLCPYLGLQIHVDRFTLIVGRILATVWPCFRFRSRVRAIDLSTDQAYLEERRKDLLIHRSITAGWFFAVQRALQQVHAEAPRLQLPLLVLQSEPDHVVDPRETQRWFQAVGSPDRTLEMLPGHRHELLQETDRHATAKRILQWLATRAGHSTS